MRKTFYFILAVFLCSTTLAHAGLLDDLMKAAGPSSEGETDDSKIASGLKEALSIGTENAVNNVSRVNGYFDNQMIKILLPEKIQQVGEVLSRIGYQKEVDDFVLSMNRAAEKAAPKAISFFGDAIREMTFEDARGILNGGNTSATEFFKRKTHDMIYNAFKPIIASSVDEVGVTRSYKEMMGKYETIPFMSKESLDLDHYVTTKAMDGLFYMVGQEEKKIRTDPAARVTDLLKSVFGK